MKKTLLNRKAGRWLGLYWLPVLLCWNGKRWGWQGLAWIPLLLCWNGIQVAAQTVPATASVGVYFTSLYDLDLANKSFNVDFWLWFNYSDSSLKPLETVEIANAKSFSYSLPDLEAKDGKIWACHKCQAVIKKEWDLRHFPFDKQRLEVRIEDAILDYSQLQYIPDSVHSNYDEGIELDEWVIKGCTIRSDNKSYHTNFGNPALDSVSTYPAVTAVFELHRNGFGLFFKLFVGIYVAYVISLIVFFMGPENPERFGLIVGALFAGVANKYIVDSLMPRTIMLTLPDKIHNLTFAYIILHLVMTVVAHRFAANQSLRRGWLTDRISFLVSLVSFFTINWILVDNALNYL
jgi:hypothetical protein